MEATPVTDSITIGCDAVIVMHEVTYKSESGEGERAVIYAYANVGAGVGITFSNREPMHFPAGDLAEALEIVGNLATLMGYMSTTTDAIYEGEIHV